MLLTQKITKYYYVYLFVFVACFVAHSVRFKKHLEIILLMHRSTLRAAVRYLMLNETFNKINPLLPYKVLSLNCTRLSYMVIIWRPNSEKCPANFRIWLQCIDI